MTSKFGIYDWFSEKMVFFDWNKRSLGFPKINVLLYRKTFPDFVFHTFQLLNWLSESDVPFY